MTITLSSAQERTMSNKSFQDYYPENVAHCYGCGRLNPDGYRFERFGGGESVTR